MQALGLKHITVPDIVCNHLLPTLHEANEAQHVAYLAVMVSSGLTAPEAANPALSTKILNKLKEVGRLATNGGFLQLKGNFVHLPTSLGNKVRSLMCITMI